MEKKRGNLWRRLIPDKYGIQNLWFSGFPALLIHLMDWDYRNTSAAYGLLLLSTRIKVGNGRQTRFWQDAWVGHAPLLSQYHDLYDFSYSTGSLVSECWNGSNWCLDFCRYCFDWEVPRMALMLKDLEKVVMYDDVPDRIIWTKQIDGVFS